MNTALAARALRMLADALEDVQAPADEPSGERFDPARVARIRIDEVTRERFRRKCRAKGIRLASDDR